MSWPGGLLILLVIHGASHMILLLFFIFSCQRCLTYYFCKAIHAAWSNLENKPKMEMTGQQLSVTYAPEEGLGALTVQNIQHCAFLFLRSNIFCAKILLIILMSII